MGVFTKDAESLKELYTTQLRYMYSTEKQIVDGLSSMIEAATEPQLKQAFQSHQQETRAHVKRLEQVLSESTGEVDDKKCAVTAALIAAGENVVKQTPAGPIRDAGLIASAQKIEHFEMASYGSAAAWAKNLGFDSQAQLLHQTLEEEKRADQLLTNIADQANQKATRAA
jgi:ferritin-like metal-binding protein YciE